MSTGSDIYRAVERYYRALEVLLTGDAGPLKEVWSQREDITTMNPYGGREVGWEQVEPVFERVAQLCAGSTVSLRIENPLIRVYGDFAYVSGIEAGEGIISGKPTTIRHRVTNIYRREDGAWKMVHRHTDLNPTEANDERLHTS